MSERESITDVIVAYGQGTPGAFDRLVSLLYPELRRIARGQLRRGQADGALLDTTALVHEAYLKLVDQRRASWHDRGHFFAIAARAMRQIIVDHARERQALKRGAGRPHEDLDSLDLAVASRAEQLLIINEALERLGAEEPRLLHVVECRFFAGYSEAETAQALSLSTRTVEREWLRAKAWLRDAVEGSPRRKGSGIL